MPHTDHMRAAALAVAILALAGGPAAASALSNGSFEQPGGDPIRTQIGDGSTGFQVPGWTNNGGYQIYESSGQDGIAAQDGTYYVSFGHNGTTGGTLSQSFATTVGTLYMLSYWLIVQQGAGTDSVGVTIAGSSGTLLNTPVDFSNTDWAMNGGVFVGDGSTVTLTFTDLGGPGNGGTNWGLDNVSVTGLQVTAVPEPGSLLLLGMGLLGLRGVRRRG